jgi:hypothetical protein
MADRILYRCVICGTDAGEPRPLRCPRCRTPARWRMVVDRDPIQPPKPEPPSAEAPKPEESAT